VASRMLKDPLLGPPLLGLENSDELMWATFSRWLLNLDGERHQAMRQRFGRVFARGRVEQYRPLIQARAGALIDAVAASIQQQLPAQPRRDIVAKALRLRGALILVRDLAQACEIANRIAPEHLELAVADAEALLASIRNAGAIFVGHYSSEAVGDYCAGPNHVLPTARSARFSSPLGVYDFQKRTSIVAVSGAGARTLGRIASTLARGEGLPAHAQSAEYRLQG